MAGPIEAEAEIALGEAIRPAAAAHARIYRGTLSATLIFAALFAAGILGGDIAGKEFVLWFPQWGDWPRAVLGIAWMIMGIFVGLQLYGHRQLSGFLAALRKLGSPETFPTRFRFEADVIAVENSRLSHRIAWPAVLFIVPEKDHWLVQVDTMTVAIPRRAFADASAEQAFLDLARDQMSDPARERSVLKSH